MWRAPSCDSSNNDHPTALPCRGAGAVHHTNRDRMRCSKKVPLFDDLVSAREHRNRYIKAECLRGFEVYDQLVFARQLNRQIGWLFTLENTVDIRSGALVELDIIHAIGCQTAVRRKITEAIDA